MNNNHLKDVHSSDFARTSQHTDAVQQQAYLLIKDMEPQNSAFVFLKAYEKFRDEQYIVYDYINMM